MGYPFGGSGRTFSIQKAGREESGERSGKKAPGTLFLVFACAVLLYLLFHPSPELSPSGALETAKNSRDLSPLMSNEEFIRTYEDAAAETVGWLVDRIAGGGFLVSYIYLDGKGDFKGWFFELPPGGREARRITRSMGDHYASLIDGRFEKCAPALSEKDRITRWVKEARSQTGRGTILEEIAGELGRTGVRKEYGWMARPLGKDRWLVGFLYEPEGAPAGEKRGWVFHVSAGEPAFLFPVSLPFAAGSVDDLLRFLGGSGEFSAEPGILDGSSQGSIPLGFFLESTLGRFGSSPLEARNLFGSPGAERHRTEPLFPGQGNGSSVVTMMWPGLSLVFSGSPGNERLVSAVVRAGNTPFGPDPGIRLGDPFSRVSALLGNPDGVTHRSAVYSGGDVPFDLVFSLKKDGRIAGMSLSAPAK